MVRIISSYECICGSCDGGERAPPDHFGGSMCVCQCHQLTGEKRDEFIREKRASLQRLIDLSRKIEDSKK